MRGQLVGREWGGCGTREGRRWQGETAGDMSESAVGSYLYNEGETAGGGNTAWEGWEAWNQVLWATRKSERVAQSVRIMYLWIVQCVQMTYLGKICRQKYNECAGNIATLL